MSCRNGIWDFTQNQSIWPLLNVITAYHAYMYSRNWLSVMAYYYILVALQILFFAALGLEYRSWFFILFDKNPDPNSDSLVLDPMVDGWCAINCSALFIGGSLQTMIGIIMGVIQVRFYAPNKYKHKYFYPVTFWKDYATKDDKKYKRELKRVNKYIKSSDMGLRYGMWPWHLWFGLDPGSIGTTEAFGKIRSEIIRAEEKREGKVLTKEEKKEREMTSIEFNKLVYAQWKFRNVFWARKLQLFLLSTPTGFIYKFVGNGPIRAGLILYILVTCSLLAIFKVINEQDYVDSCIDSQQLEKDNSEEEEEDEDSRSDKEEPSFGEGDDFEVEWNFSVMMNHYERLYAVWMLTCVFLVGFQMLSILTTFFRVLISTGIVIGCTIIVNLIHYLVKDCCSKKRTKYKKL